MLTRTQTHSHAKWHSHRKELGLQYLAQGNLDMQTEEAGWTTDLMIVGRPNLSVEPQTPPEPEIVAVARNRKCITSCTPTHYSQERFTLHSDF